MAAAMCAMERLPTPAAPVDLGRIRTRACSVRLRGKSCGARRGKQAIPLLVSLRERPVNLRSNSHRAAGRSLPLVTNVRKGDGGRGEESSPSSGAETTGPALDRDATAPKCLFVRSLALTNPNGCPRSVPLSRPVPRCRTPRATPLHSTPRPLGSMPSATLSS